MDNLTEQERQELAEILSMPIMGMDSARWRRYVELRQRERGEDVNNG